jgi:signal transduction histidine kinase
LRPTAEFKQIQLIFNPSAELNLVADLNMLNTILRNLISNAIKYCNICGNVVISCELIDKNIQISITDNGVGMSSSLLNTLFVLSEKVSSPGTANERGTGLGLILCKEFVEKMGGQIWAESELGIGSSFYVNLPHHSN